MNNRVHPRTASVRRRLSWIVGLLVLLALWPIGCVGDDEGNIACTSAALLPLPGWWGEGDWFLLVAPLAAVLAFAAVRWLPWRRDDSDTPQSNV